MTKKVCPKCKSKNIVNKITVMSSLLGFHPKNKCADCGFESYIIYEKDNRKRRKK